MSKIDEELGKKGIRGIFLKSYNKGLHKIGIGCLFILIFIFWVIFAIVMRSSMSDNEWIQYTHSNPIFIISTSLSIIFFILSLPMMFFSAGSYDKKKFSFYCPYPDCHKSILTEKIGKLVCPNCDSKDEFKKLILGCEKCSTILQYYECPYCKRIINLFADYDENKIKTEIYNG